LVEERGKSRWKTLNRELPENFKTGKIGKSDLYVGAIWDILGVKNSDFKQREGFAKCEKKEEGGTPEDTSSPSLAARKQNRSGEIATTLTCAEGEQPQPAGGIGKEAILRKWREVNPKTGDNLQESVGTQNMNTKGARTRYHTGGRDVSGPDCGQGHRQKGILSTNTGR